MATDIRDATVAGNDTPETLWNITEVIEQQARRHPAALAVILADRLINYREMIAAVHAIAHTLLANGVRAGQTVGVSMLQTPLHLMTLLAIARINAVSVPVHPMLPKERRYLAARRFGATAIVSGRLEFKLEGIPFIPLKAIDLGASSPALPASGSAPDSPCWIALSSGTSGDPKGVLCTHGYMLDRVGKTIYERTPQSRILPMDLNFGTGFGQSVRMLLAGGAVVLVPENTPANQVFMVRSHAVTHWLMSPVMAQDIAPLLTDDDIHFPALACLYIVGGAPNPRLLDTLLRRFTPNILVGYGTVEVGPVATATSEILRRAPGSAGRLCPWATAEIVDHHDRPVPAGQVGRLRLKSAGMLNAYYLDPDLNATRFRNGWYYPYDMARIDAEGLLYIEGREDDVINVGGSKIYYRDVEKMLESHPAVREAAAFAHAAQDGRDLLAAALIMTRPIPVAELMAWTAAQLGPVCPDRLFYVDVLPRTATGKVLRDRLSLPPA
jgi:acyl-coenzyme A synthetase/AMP-(fatty) acid ligase